MASGAYVLSGSSSPWSVAVIESIIKCTAVAVSAEYPYGG